YPREPWVEHFDWLDPLFEERLETKNGRMIVPARPGLGVTLSGQARAGPPKPWKSARNLEPMSRNLTADLAADLRNRIVDGVIQPGEKLPSENTLISEYGVSRTVVRSALTRLPQRGIG